MQKASLDEKILAKKNELKKLKIKQAKLNEKPLIKIGKIACKAGIEKLPPDILFAEFKKIADLQKPKEPAPKKRREKKQPGIPGETNPEIRRAGR